MNSQIHEAQTLCVQNLSLWRGNLCLFQNLSWFLTPGKWTCLLGQSGIGKSSLLRLIAGLHSETSRIQGTLPPPKRIAYLGQNDALLPWLSVFDNACLSAKIGAYSRSEKEAITKRAATLLEKVGLGESVALYPRQLSSGMRQRVALVRALAEDKPIILMDEPFSRLDAITRHQLQNLAAELLKNKTVLLVTHDPSEALRLADKIDILAGRPAQIETLTVLTTQRPRELNTPELLDLQQKLFQTLSDHYCSSNRLHCALDSTTLKTAS